MSGTIPHIKIPLWCLQLHFSRRYPLFTPVGAPRVAPDPVVLACLGVRAVASDGDLVVHLRAIGLVDKDAAGVAADHCESGGPDKQGQG